MTYEVLQPAAPLTRGEHMVMHKRLARMVATAYPNIDERAAVLGETENLIGLLFERMNVVRIQLRNREIVIVPKEKAIRDDLI